MIEVPLATGTPPLFQRQLVTCASCIPQLTTLMTDSGVAAVWSAEGEKLLSKIFTVY